MKNRIIDAIGKIDDEMIESVDVIRHSQKKSVKPVWIKWVAVAACLCMVVGGIKLTNRANAIGEIKYSMEELIDKYMDAIEGEDYRMVSAIIPSGMVGIYKGENSSYISIEQAEKESMFLKKNKDSLEKIKQILEYQHEEIVRMWGANAFNDYTYELIEMEPEAAFSKEIYIVKASGEKVDFDQYLAMNHDYWKEIGEKNGIDPSLLFTPEYTELYLENIENEPVKIALEGSGTEYLVKLYFDGADTTEDGIQFFRFYIKGTEDSWAIKLGMQWDYPLSVTDSDI